MTIKKLFVFLFTLAVFGIAGLQSSYAHGAKHNHKHASGANSGIAVTTNRIAFHSKGFHKNKLIKAVNAKHKLHKGKKAKLVFDEESGGWTCWWCCCVWGLTHSGPLMNMCQPQAGMEDCRNHRNQWCDQYGNGTGGGEWWTQ